MKTSLLALAAGLMVPMAPVMAQAAPAAAAAPASAITNEDARLTAFLDAEFAEYVKGQPQLATRLGLKDGGDQWNDISDAASDAQVAWRQASAARMKAQFDRSKLSGEGQVNYDIWAQEAERAAMANANRVYSPPFYWRLCSLQTRYQRR